MGGRSMDGVGNDFTGILLNSLTLRPSQGSPGRVINVASIHIPTIQGLTVNIGFAGLNDSGTTGHLLRGRLRGRADCSLTNTAPATSMPLSHRLLRDDAIETSSRQHPGRVILTATNSARWLRGIPSNEALYRWAVFGSTLLMTDTIWEFSPTTNVWRLRAARIVAARPTRRSATPQSAASSNQHLHGWGREHSGMAPRIHD